MLSKLSFHEFRLFFETFYFTLKLFYFGIFFFLNSFDFRLMLYVFLIQKLGNVNFWGFIFLLFKKDIFNKISWVTFKPIKFVFLLLLSLKNVFVCLKAIFKRQLTLICLVRNQVWFNFMFKFIYFMERFFQRIHMRWADFILIQKFFLLKILFIIKWLFINFVRINWHSQRRANVWKS